MRQMLGKKQLSESSDWQYVYDHIQDFVSVEHITARSLSTAKRLKSIVEERGYKAIGYGWSGGKDSLVMHEIIKLSGIQVRKGVCILYETEYPEMERWLIEHAPVDCEVRRTNKFTLQQLNEHPELLFPNKSKWISAYNPPRWDVQNAFRKDYGLDVLITGRRCIDGNFCGSKDNDYISKNKHGDSLNIIADWTHEELLGFIKYNNIELPPCYFYPKSWRFGTHCWTERTRLGEYPFTENLDEVFKLDPSILFNARGELEVAERYLRERGL